MKLLKSLLTSAMILGAASAHATVMPAVLSDQAPANDFQLICACVTMVNLEGTVSWSVDEIAIVAEVPDVAPPFVWTGGGVFTWVQFPPAVGGWTVEAPAAAVPEPATYTMMGASLLLLGAARRRARGYNNR